jgi:hypothetical protein
MRFLYQSIDKKHIKVHVKFESGLSIHIWRKKEIQKNQTFSKGVPCPFLKSWSMKIYRLEFSLMGLNLALSA